MVYFLSLFTLIPNNCRSKIWNTAITNICFAIHLVIPRSYTSPLKSVIPMFIECWHLTESYSVYLLACISLGTTICCIKNACSKQIQEIHNESLTTRENWGWHNPISFMKITKAKHGICQEFEFTFDYESVKCNQLEKRSKNHKRTRIKRKFSQKIKHNSIQCGKKASPLVEYCNISRITILRGNFLGN